MCYSSPLLSIESIQSPQLQLPSISLNLFHPHRQRSCLLFFPYRTQIIARPIQHHVRQVPSSLLQLLGFITHLSLFLPLQFFPLSPRIVSRLASDVLVPTSSINQQSTTWLLAISAKSSSPVPPSIAHCPFNSVLSPWLVSLVNLFRSASIVRNTLQNQSLVYPSITKTHQSTIY